MGKGRGVVEKFALVIAGLLHLEDGVMVKEIFVSERSWNYGPNAHQIKLQSQSDRGLPMELLLPFP